MALTFPADTNNPYVDTTSGLKYIYNNAVGAWESAIQPPVIITDAAPQIDLNGFLWYDTAQAAAFIRLNNNWVALNPPQVEDPDTGEIINYNLVMVSADPPESARHGQLWWDSSLGRLFVYYVDPTTDPQWLEASPNIDGINGGIAFAGPDPPSGATEGEMWFNTSSKELLIYYNGSWVGVKSQIEGVETLSAQEPIYILPGDDSDKNPTVAIRTADSARQGSVRFATQSEANAGSSGSVVLSPLSLGNILSTDPDVYIADATEGRKGIVELATVAEAQAGTSTTTVVTPAALKSALDTSGDAVPTGMIMMFSTGTIPPGYLICDGTAYPRDTYGQLFGVIGILYGAGDGSGTFNVPDLKGNSIDGFLGVYCIKT